MFNVKERRSPVCDRRSFKITVKKDKNNAHLIGKVAVTDSELNPSGTVLIDNEIYEVKTDGEYVEAGRGVRVTRVHGKKIFVRRV